MDRFADERGNRQDADLAALGPGGFLGLVEALRQITGAAPGRTVANPRLGLVSGYGMVAYDRCLCTGAVILGSAT